MSVTSCAGHFKMFINRETFNNATPFIFSRNGGKIENNNYCAEAVVIASLGVDSKLYLIRKEQVKILFGWDATTDSLARNISMEYSRKSDKEFIEYAIKITGKKDLVLPEVNFEGVLNA